MEDGHIDTTPSPELEIDMARHFTSLLGRFGAIQRTARAPHRGAFARPSIEDRLIALFRRFS